MKTKIVLILIIICLNLTSVMGQEIIIKKQLYTANLEAYTGTWAFKKFGENYNTERLDKLYLDTQKSGTDMYANLRQFLEILNNTDSGLTFSLGEFDMGSSDPDIVWDIRSLQSIDSNLKTGCN